MGKKAREEREEKRESFASKRTRQKRKNLLMAAGVLGVVAVIVGYSAYTFVNLQGAVPGAPPGAGTLGDEHEHIALLVRIHGDKFDFSLPSYQIKSSWIHFEGSDGDTIHRHASGVTMGYLFETLRIVLTDECFAFQSQQGERDFCTNDDYSLKFFINHRQVPSILDYVGQEDDRILISYGGESPEEIEKQLQELDSQLIIK
ncbi:MAG TPA: protein-disulfide isomerase [Nitrosopumilaceae archaeon]|nr:protein-disulfide isomerase [Nitrosopumilaceae archaeon]